MPELTLDDLSALFAWIVDAQEFLPLSEQAKGATDKLIAQQTQLKRQTQASELDDMIDYYQVTAW